MKGIQDSAVYARQLDSHLPRLYHLVFWKRNLEEKSTWEPALAVQHLQKLVKTFDAKYPDKSIAIFHLFNTTPPMVKPIVKLIKQKRGYVVQFTKIIKHTQKR